MNFEQALDDGDLDKALAILAELSRQPETGGLYMPECYAELARSFDHRGRHDDAIAAMRSAIEHGWSGHPDPRSDIAEIHLHAGRPEKAADIWAQLKAEDPSEIWLYNAAGLSYKEIDEHQLAVDWLTEGIELAMSTDDPEGLVAQLSDARRQSLQALGRELDELERRVEPFLTRWQAREQERKSGYAMLDTPDGQIKLPDAPARQLSEASEIAIALAWFPSGEYERAVERWPSLAEDWTDIEHADYCRRFDGHIKWMRANGVPVRAVAPIAVDELTSWCEEHGEDPEHARAQYAAHLMATGNAIPWPPSRNEPCWCGSQRKYKKCCGPAAAAAMKRAGQA